MFAWLRNKHYKSYRGIMLAWLILGIFGQDKEIYPAENINFAYGYSYYFFAKRVTRCIRCLKVVEDSGWQHSDQETQWCFEETGSEFLLETASENEEVEAVACSESCWRQFMEDSFGHWNDRDY